MARTVVAHGVLEGSVPDDLPYVPDRFVLAEGGRYWSVDRATGEEVDVGRAGFEHMAGMGSVVPLPEPHPRWEEGRWAALEESGLSFFDRGDEERWKVSRAQDLLRQARALEGEPERALSLLRASGALVGIPVAALVGRLEQERESPEEDLADIYVRVRK